MLKGGSVFDKTTIIKDSGGNNVKVPGGFKIAEDSANNVSDGVVIEDSSGNQFVWIPIKRASDLDLESSFNKPTSDYTVLSNWNQTGWSELDVNFIVNAGGFYVGRFETGLLNNKVVVQKNAGVYRDISVNTAISQAGKVHSSSTARTSIVIDNLWDAVMRFVHNKKTASGRTYDVYSNMGGKNDDIVANIYKLGDGLPEYTGGVFQLGDVPVVRGSTTTLDSSNAKSTTPSLWYYAHYCRIESRKSNYF